MGAIWPYIAVVVIVALLFAAERRWPNGVTRMEENFLAILLALITLVSFFQVVARYGFNSGWTGALEFDAHPVRLDDPVRHGLWHQAGPPSRRRRRPPDASRSPSSGPSRSSARSAPFSTR